MNDLPQNELFSAYLDGELTAAERAEMEQLLAANPAARQLLDELRALSTTLQTLPHETLGEDLSRQVLRMAERRMPTDGRPGDAEAMPTPLVQSVFRRFATRRNLVWLGLTASIAMMVYVNEQWQGARPIQVARQSAPVSSSGPAPVESVRKPGPPPSIQAAHDVDAAGGTAEPTGKRAEKKFDRYAGSDKRNDLSAKSGMKSAPRSDEPEEEFAKREEPRVNAPAASPSPEPPFARSPKGAVDIEPPRSQHGATAGIAARKGPGVFDTEQSEGVDDSLLVVQCDVSPKAVANQSLNKLLVANGITQNEQSEQIGAVWQEQAKDAKNNELSAPTADAGDESFVYVEATPAQVAATLAGLAAQPDLFHAVSVESAQDEQSQTMVRSYQNREQSLRQLADGLRSNLQSNRAGRSLTKADEPTAVLKEKRSATLGAAATPTQEPLLREDVATELAPEAEDDKGASIVEQQPSLPAGRAQPHEAGSMQRQQLLQRQLERQQVVQPSLRQQVLFVVRVVDDDQPPVVKNGVDANVAAPAKETNKPAANQPRP